MKYVLNLLCLILLSGCKVGPDYSLPVTPVPVDYSEDQADKTFTIEDEDFFKWWTIFEDPFLNSLLEEVLQENFDYKIALEQVCQARSQYWMQVTQILPEFITDFQASRFRTSRSFASSRLNPATVSPLQNFFQTGLDAIWEIDLFGRLRRAAAAAYDVWEASAEDARAVKIVVLSEVATTYAAICAFQDNVDVASQIVAVDEQLLELSKARFDAGLANEQEVQAAFASLQADSATLILFETTLKLNIYSLATLLGKLPECVIADFEERHSIPYAWGRVPSGLPSDLLRRRPDIRSAERNLAAATEQIGVAVAELFPQVSLTGSSSSFAANPLQGANIGFSSDTASQLFNHGSRIWGIGGLVTFPVFDFGKRFANVDVQKSLRQQAYLSYQKTVITAFEEVEQALAAYFDDEKRVYDLTGQSESYKRILELVTAEYEAGLVNYDHVLQAKQAWLLTVNSLTEVRQALATDLIALYKALGGDW